MPDITAPITDPEEFLKLTADQLDTIFRNASAGPIPNGQGEGTAIIAPGTAVSDTIARFIHVFSCANSKHIESSNTLLDTLIDGNILSRLMAIRIKLGHDREPFSTQRNYLCVIFRFHEDYFNNNFSTLCSPAFEGQ